MSEIETAQAAIKGLEGKQQHLVQRSVELADERNRIAFGAHVEGDAKSRKRLDAINIELATMASEQSSIESALVEANARFAAAKRDTVLAADRAQAEALRAKLAKFTEIGVQLDDAIWDIATSVNEMVELLNAMHQLGAASPTSEQFRVNGTLCIKTMLQNLPQLWVRDFEFQMLAPNQKKTFKALVAGWHAMIEQSLASRLGETKQTEAA